MTEPAISSQSLDFIINHVALPPKLPQESEDRQLTHLAEQDLLRLVSSQVEAFRLQHLQTDAQSANVCNVWASIRTMTTRLALLNSPQTLSVKELTKCFINLRESGECFQESELCFY